MGVRYSYNKLWKKLIDIQMTKTEMRKKAGLSTNVLAKMGKGEAVSLNSLAKVCTLFSCSINDILEIENTRKNEE